MKTKYIITTVIAALVLPLSWASATTSLEFNNSANNMVGGALQTVNVTQGGQFTLSLQINSTVGTTGLDYWLSQFSGPATGVFSLISRSNTGSLYPDAGTPDSQVLATTDTWSNSANSNTSDGVADNVLGPQNARNLGSTKTDTTVDNPAGVNQVFNFTFQVANSAAFGTYQLRSLSYPGFGWGSTTTGDAPFNNHAAINVAVVVPEPATLSLLGLGSLASVGLGLLRARGRLG